MLGKNLKDLKDWSKLVLSGERPGEGHRPRCPRRHELGVPQERGYRSNSEFRTHTAPRKVLCS